MVHGITNNRQIRVFISSTFQDMQGERDELMKKVFPRLESLAEERGVSIVPLDLRWGITKEESENGKVVEICLNEINNCRPFFIGIVGHRYGWCPGKRELFKNSNLKDRYGNFIDEFDDTTSVTEMEMQFGVLRNPAKIDAYFYFKSGEDPKDSHEQLERLRTQIREDGRYPVKEYSEINEFAKMVEQDFFQLLDERFPAVIMDSLTQSRFRTESIINNYDQCFIEDKSQIANLDEWLDDDKEQFMVVIGEHGIGKSALVAHMANKWKDRTDYNVICHFIGENSKHDEGEAVAKWMQQEIANLYKLDKDTKLSQMMNEISGKAKLVVILDGIDKFPSKSGDKQLLWLPIAPTNVKFLLTTTSEDESMESISYYNWLSLKMVPLTIDQRKTLITDYLAQYRKKIDPRQVDKIAADDQNENTLSLISLLNELIYFGDFDSLNQRIDEYLSAKNAEEFFDMVLTRCEEDYGKTLVTDVLSMILLSRSGLSEDEIIRGADIKPLYWSQFYCAFKIHLRTISGLISINNDQMAAAIEKRYINSENLFRSYSRRITALFQEGKAGRDSYELTFQYYYLNDMEALHQEICNLDVFRYAAEHSELEPVSIWRKLLNDKQHHYNLEEYIYLFPTNPSLDDIKALAEIAHMAYYKFGQEAIGMKMMLTTWEAQKRRSEDSATATDIEMELGNFYYASSLNDKAWDIYEDVLKKRNNLYGYYDAHVASTLEMMGHILNCSGKFDAAEQLYRKSLDIYQNVYSGPHYKTANLIHDLATLSHRQGQYDRAIPLYEKAIRIWHQTLGDLSTELVAGYGMMAQCYEEWGNKSEALDNYFQCFFRCRKIYGEKHKKSADYALRILLLARDLEIENKLSEEQKEHVKDILMGTMVTAKVRPDGNAATMGLEGKYAVLSYASWDISQNKNFFTEQIRQKGHHKDILFYRDGKYKKLHFSGPIGVSFSIALGDDYKQAAVKALRNYQ